MQALLAKGADPAQRDEFGHTAWDHAIGHAMQEAAFIGSGLPAVFELLAPPALDVQTDGRLVLLELPAWLWADKRRKRTYVNQVLARAEVHGSYQPARRLWVRTRNGHYFPNPQLQLRAGDGWQPVYEQLALDWLDRGSGREIDHRPRPAESIRWVRETVERGAGASEELF